MVFEVFRTRLTLPPPAPEALALHTRTTRFGTKRHQISERYHVSYSALLLLLPPLSRPGRDELRLSACDWQVAERGLLLHLHHATTSPLITEPVMIAADWPRVTAQHNCTQIARGARRAPPPRTCCEGGVGCSAAHINSEHSTLERKELNRSDRAGVGLRSLHRPRASKRLRSLHVGRMLYGCLDVHRGVLMARS